MNEEFGRIVLILALGIIVCLPAQTANAAQAGSSSPMSDRNAQGNVFSGLPAGTAADSVGKT